MLTRLFVILEATTRRRSISPVSKLSDLLKQASQAYNRPMGLTPAKNRTQALPLVLIAQVDSLSAGAIEAAVAAGAEAVLAPVSATADVKGAKAAAGKASLGGLLDAGTKAEVDQLEKDGCDFFVLRSANLPADVLQGDDRSAMLELDSSLPDAVLRGVEGLNLDGAVYRIPGSEVLTLQHLLQLRRTAGLAGKPLFVAAPDGLAPGAAEVLRDAGAVGLIVPAAAVAAFKATIAALPQPKRKGDRMDATLPAGFYTAPQKEAEHDDDGDDDD